MSLLAEVLFEVIFDALGDVLGSGSAPDSDRGIVAAFTAGSAALAAVAVWLLLTSANPLTEPAWGFWVLAGSIFCGGAGFLVSFLHLRRIEAERLFAVLCLSANVTAIVAPLLVLTIH